MICLLATSFSPIVNAEATNTSQEESPDLSFSYEEVKEMFPQSNIKKYQESTNIMSSSSQQIIYDADDVTKTPIEVYSATNGKFTQYLAEYEDGSYVTYGLSGTTGINGNGSYQSGYYRYYKGIVYWNNYAGYASMRYNVTYRVHDVTGAANVTDTSLNFVRFVRPITLTKTTTTATMKGDVLGLDEVTVYARLALKLTVRTGGGTTVTPSIVT